MATCFGNLRELANFVQNDRLFNVWPFHATLTVLLKAAKLLSLCPLRAPKSEL